MRPGDQRGFLHKSKFGRIFTGAIGTILPKVPVLGTALGIADVGLGFIRGGGRRGGRGFGRRPRPATPIPVTFEPIVDFPTVVPGVLPENIVGTPGGGGGSGGSFTPLHENGCDPPFVMDPRGFCVGPTSPLGAATRGGDAINGRFGPAQVPGSRIVDVAKCERGMVLGKDGLCYDNLPNKNRLYPRGRRPLLTGGDMRAISRARTAGNKLANAKSDLIAIGMLKAAGPRKRRKKTPTTC